MLEGLNVEELLELGEYILDCDHFETVEEWVAGRKQQKDAGNQSKEAYRE